MQAPPSNQFTIAYSSISSNRPQFVIATLLPALPFSYPILTQGSSFFQSQVKKAPDRSRVSFSCYGYIAVLIQMPNKCRFVNHMLHKREIEKEPHEEISILGDA